MLLTNDAAKAQRIARFLATGVTVIPSLDTHKNAIAGTGFYSIPWNEDLVAIKLSIVAKTGSTKNVLGTLKQFGGANTYEQNRGVFHNIDKYVGEGEARRMITIEEVIEALEGNTYKITIRQSCDVAEVLTPDQISMMTNGRADTPMTLEKYELALRVARVEDGEQIIQDYEKDCILYPQYRQQFLCNEGDVAMDFINCEDTAIAVETARTQVAEGAEVSETAKVEAQPAVM